MKHKFNPQCGYVVTVFICDSSCRFVAKSTLQQAAMAAIISINSNSTRLLLTQHVNFYVAFNCHS